MNLLRVAVEDSLDVGIRQVAAITFKNATRKDWDPLGDLPDGLFHTLCMPLSRALPCPSPFLLPRTRPTSLNCKARYFAQSYNAL